MTRKFTSADAELEPLPEGFIPVTASEACPACGKRESATAIGQRHGRVLLRCDLCAVQFFQVRRDRS